MGTDGRVENLLFDDRVDLQRGDRLINDFLLTAVAVMAFITLKPGRSKSILRSLRKNRGEGLGAGPSDRRPAGCRPGLIEGRPDTKGGALFVMRPKLTH